MRAARKRIITVASGALLAGAAVAGIALARRGHAATPDASIDADLQLAAAAPTTGPYALTETAPSSKPEIGTRLHRGAGTKAVRSKRPTVKASPEPSSSTEEKTPVTETVAAAPAPGPTEAPSEPAAAGTPRPVAVPVSYPSGAGDSRGSGDVGNAGGSGVGAVLGGILGAVIRGGAVDGDNCERDHGGRRRGRGVYGTNPGGVYGNPGGVYGGNPGGVYMPIIGGVGTASRFPVRQR